MSDIKEKTKIGWIGKTQTNVKRSKKHERRLAEELGGKREARSGGLAYSAYDRAGPYGPSARTAGRDITTEMFYIEHKHTIKKAMSFKQEWLEGITKTAKNSLKEPAMIITFEPDPNTTEYRDAEQDWAVLPISIFKRLIANKSEEADE